MIPRDWLDEAAARIAGHSRLTPLQYDRENDLYLKWENQQVTGSFKVRGALNKVLALQPWERDRGLVTASAGNHGQGVALAGNLAGAKTIVFASEHAIQAKVAAMLALGADVRLVPGGYGEAEQTALTYARENGATWVSPYNDNLVIAGQGTIGLELLQQLPPDFAGVCLVPAGGGGLAAGIGAALDGRRPRIPLIAVQSDASAYLHRLYHLGTQDGVAEVDSLADGLSGAVEPGSVTIPLARHYLEDFILVSEAEIGYAVAYAWDRYQQVIEGSAGVTLAAVLSGKMRRRPAALILSGGNIQPEVHAGLIERYQERLLEGKSR
jgi:threonine dehydratase